MRGLTIQARSYDSAQSLYGALGEFHPELLGNDEQGYTVSVQVGNTDGHLLRLLDAVQRYATERHTLARVEMDGHRYTIHGDGATASAARVRGHGRTSDKPRRRRPLALGT